ncbi:carboxymuconolactone decarboxylase family protein [Nocardia sp. 2]|uniref:Carboxymuconolactone decarboxylase family protein n=1 Tax=Nocardia acididurans TaxID=2802282 RepID=A0ABS1MDA1_9NOCA|nr:carboxymuconolactone decarboxylase family protein [Nocardia acididurans]MBL1078627.1 carboxymuconolactone decarboxylase family protein [Nocardia acididurans]
MARIAPLEPPYDDETGALLARMMPGAEPISLFRMFARKPPMAGAMHVWGRYELGRELSLSRRERELVIDRTCARCGCEYEWGVHIAIFAERAGITAEQQTSLTHGSHEDPCWTRQSERLLLEAVDALHDHSDIGDELWARLAQVFDEQQLMDLLLLCGWYHAISFTARATRLESEPGTPRFRDVLPESALRREQG